MTADDRHELEGLIEAIRALVARLQRHDQPLATIKPGDVVICFNYRTDRCREITEVLTQIDIPDQGMKKLNLDFTTIGLRWLQTIYPSNLSRCGFPRQILEVAGGHCPL